MVKQKRRHLPGPFAMLWVMVRAMWGARHMAQLAFVLGEMLDMVQCSELLKCTWKDQGAAKEEDRPEPEGL